MEKNLIAVPKEEVIQRYNKNSVSPEFLALVYICVAAIEKSNGQLAFTKVENDHRVIFTNREKQEPNAEDDFSLHLMLDGEESGISLEFIEVNGKFIGWDIAFAFMFRLFLTLKQELPKSFEIAKKMMIELCEKYNIKQNFEALEEAFSHSHFSKSLSGMKLPESKSLTLL